MQCSASMLGWLFLSFYFNLQVPSEGEGSVKIVAHLTATAEPGLGHQGEIADIATLKMSRRMLSVECHHGALGNTTELRQLQRILREVELRWSSGQINNSELFLFGYSVLATIIRAFGNSRLQLITYS